MVQTLFAGLSEPSSLHQSQQTPTLSAVAGQFHLLEQQLADSPLLLRPVPSGLSGLDGGLLAVTDINTGTSNGEESIHADDDAAFFASPVKATFPDAQPQSLLALIDVKAIVFYWFRELDCDRAPKSHDFVTRPLGIARPGRDVVVLPDDVIYRNAWAFFQKHRPGLEPWQVVFLPGSTSLVDSPKQHDDFLAAIATVQPLIPNGLLSLTICPYLVTNSLMDACDVSKTSLVLQKISAEAEATTVRIFGDPVATTMTKSVLHPVVPTITTDVAGTGVDAHGVVTALNTNISTPISDKEAAEADEEGEEEEAFAPFCSVAGVRVAQGFACYTESDLLFAFRAMRANRVEHMIFKPSFTQGGLGICDIKAEEDITSLPLNAFLDQLGDNGADYGSGEDVAPFVLEEFIHTDENVPSPGGYCMDGEVLLLCDQVIASRFCHGGNEFPSQLEATVAAKCYKAMLSLRDEWSSTLRGFWGVDFVIDRNTDEPVLIDLNTSRPNGNHPALIHNSTLIPNPERKWKFCKVKCPTVSGDIFQSLLEQSGLLYNPSTDDGITFLSYCAGANGRIFICAKTREEIEELYQAYVALLLRAHKASENS